MVSVSDNFKALSLSNGRHVYCKVIADGIEFRDDSLLEFTFDDVTHPDWYTVGTTCANRFHFRVRYAEELDVSAEVRPYISFDGEEWCPLGIFYISRRYVRGNTLSVTAYDRMYSLDTEYLYTGELPTTSDVLLESICAENGLTLTDSGLAVDVTYIPELCTVRDMIGFIAGLNRACAKIDRYGALTLKICDFDGITEHISSVNCMDIQRNLTRSVVTCLKAQTDDGMLVAGEGAEISTLEMYNPLMTQPHLEQMYSLYKPFGFYGADVEMQGLPYLESGEAILLLDGLMAYPIVISEIEFHYDGGFTATLYSRNRTMVEACPCEDDLENVLAQLRSIQGLSVNKYENPQRVDFTNSGETTLAQFSFKSVGAGFAKLDANFNLFQYTSNDVKLIIYVNGEQRRYLNHVPYHDRGEVLHFCHTEVFTSAGEYTITLAATTIAGLAYIKENMMQAVLFSQGATDIKNDLAAST